jgi:hypothetical protein
MGQLEDAVKCPECGTWGARKSWFKVKCVNPNCRRFDGERAAAFEQNRIVGRSADEVYPHLKDMEGKADPSEYGLKIRYRNFRGDEIVYAADAQSGYQEGQHVVFRLAPTGSRVTFHLERIQNRGEVEAVVGKNPQPTRNERRTIRRHVQAGTTSKKFKELRAKYPDYRD